MFKELDSARNSFKFVLNKYCIKKIHMPYYLCDVMRHSAFSVGCKPVFYHIDDEFMPIKDFSKGDYILYPNYFGICDKNVDVLVKEYPNIIIDNAHSYYSPPKGFACFNSRKKFLNVTNGSDLWFEEYTENRTISSKIVKDRQDAFKLIAKEYDNDNLLNITSAYSPFVYPYLAKTEAEANIVVAKMVKSGKIIYRYWNGMPKSYNEYKFYSRLVPIPIS